jgi:hypothetical protein
VNCVVRPLHIAASILIGGLTSIPSRPLASQEGIASLPGRAVILVTVTDSTLRPLVDAQVAISPSYARVRVDRAGTFRIADLSSGLYMLSVRRLGFRSLVSTVVLSDRDTLRLAVTLEPSIIEVAPVIVNEASGSARLREFEARRRQGLGEFFDQQHIENRSVVSAADILREAKSLRLSMYGGKLVAMSGRQWTPCPMQIYIDGIPLSGAGPGPNQLFDVNSLPSPKELMGIEVYAGPASEPLWLPSGPASGKTACGAVLVWTRDGSLPHIPSRGS